MFPWLSFCSRGACSTLRRRRHSAMSEETSGSTGLPHSSRRSRQSPSRRSSLPSSLSVRAARSPSAAKEPTTPGFSPVVNADDDDEDGQGGAGIVKIALSPRPTL
ncbi:uncharacterized protein LOC119381574 [Rhipicephalus sanguineus]|uniref:uncharacterized protein LOC119381574 n=1 Tax=Rhipicephalus sanguineus TaxID=34632 RepID=UPI001895092B|nr:uncharacterized protein LOC119381574 [Rhipicephalus sanguineus]